MKTIFITSLILLFSGCNGQSKKEAMNLFYKSENRISLKITKSEFNTFYKSAKCLSKEYNIKLSDMPIFQIHKSDDFIDNGRFRQTLFGLGDTIFPAFKDDGTATKTCNAFITSR